ncbi:macrophage colony-stimulating factor 1 receptor [Hemicordylus capensis]|uniref:macrophage colony-stimulating factor 1 receptor n=1 Tax=Hemicordylus capensis TaxID=884348 RepID=UPI00230212D1|nr:macrophage colony-stimulating factor 1 receptor [Hemicordylus capensis]XP_053159762.1 macrophage colony-stimulating factor 1 receptor [Hemicordylus capensis]
MGPAVLMFLIGAADIWRGSASPAISPNVSTVTVNEGDPVSLLCSGSSRVVWLGIKNGPTVTVHNNGTLYISSASCKHMGKYQCAYINNTDVETASVYLSVRGPRWCVLKEAIEVVEGREALLPCLIDAAGFTGNVTLLKNSRENITKGFSFSAQDGARLDKITMDAKGRYQCQALIQGQLVKSSKISLRVRENKPVSIFIKRKEYVRIQGEPFSVTCRLSYNSADYLGNWSHPTAKVNWTSNEYIDKLSNKYTTDLILYIPAVKLSDGGNYTCFGNNSVGSTESAAISLHVAERGYVHLSTMQNTSQEIKLHGSLKLKVLMGAYPTPLYWGWTHTDPSTRSKTSTDNGSMSSFEDRYNNTFRLDWMKESESGMYTFFAGNGEANASITFNITVRTPPKISVTVNGSKSLLCIARGYPAPHVEWYKVPSSHYASSCNQGGTLVKNDTSPQIMDEIPLGRVSLKSEYVVKEIWRNWTFCCLAVNTEGNESRRIDTPSVEKIILPEPTGTSRTVILSFVGTLVFLLLCILFLFYKYKQKPKYQVHWKIIEACEGNNYIFIDPTQLPYNEKWEFPRNNLQFGKTLGAGAFGKVIEATAFGLGKEDSVLKVAVKMLKSTANTDEQEALMSELKIMSHLGHHENIVNLLGACTHGGPVFVITEYCPYGDLLNFLRKKAERLITQDLTLESSLDSTTADYKNIYLAKKYVRSDSGLGSHTVDTYLEMRPVTASATVPAKGKSSESAEEKDDSHPLDLHDLMQFSNQVAQGMDFLASKNCIHRDLAARNVLVADGRVAKICDFGLARDIMNDANYVVKGNARLPVKWMAPESIFECVYTVQSDVWSYGILLWEIFSLGRSPYPGMKVNSDFYRMVKQGYHMARPDFAPDDIYNIMKACWNLEPTHRPTFSQICTFIQKQLDASKEQDYTNLPSNTDEDSGCDPASYCEESCESGESSQPLLNSNNYQFC